MKIYNKGQVIKEIPVDFRDPATFTYDEYWLDRAVQIWKVSGSLFPPTPDELQVRPSDWDSECMDYRQMVEFYEHYDERPDTLKEDAGQTWESHLTATG